MQNTPALLVLFSSSSFFCSACRSISAVLLRVTAAMAGAVCGQTLPVVVKAQTISRSAGPLFLSLSLFLCRLLYCTDRESEEGRGQESVKSMEVKIKKKKRTDKGETVEKWLKERELERGKDGSRAKRLTRERERKITKKHIPFN